MSINVKRCIERSAIASVIAIATFATSAWAVPIDLTGAAGASLAGAQTGVLDDPTLGPISFGAGPGTSLITHTAGAGLGIDCRGSIWCAWDFSNEIDAFEVMTITFAEPVQLNSVTVADLFAESGLLGLSIEGGYLLGDSFAIHFSAADATSTDGWLTFDVGQEVGWIKITAEVLWHDDFTLAGLDADLAAAGGGSKLPIGSPAPEASASTLFALGFAVVGALTRRRS